jgi:hypothetical protein
MMSKLRIIILAGLLVTFGGLAPCSAEPQKVAILPVYFHSIQSDAAVGKVIEQSLAGKFRTPLAAIVPVYAIIPAGEITPVLPVAPAGGKKVKLDGAVLAAIGDKLSADIVVAAEVTQYYTYTYFREGDPYRRLDFEIRLLSYHKPSGALFDKREHTYYHGDDYPMVQPEYLARQMMAALLDRVPAYR